MTRGGMRSTNLGSLRGVTLLLAAALAACSSIRVTTDRAETADFSRLATWAWLPRPPSSDPLMDNTLVLNRIRDAVARALDAKGYVRADAGHADFLADFATTTRERIDVVDWPSSWGWSSFHDPWCGSWWWDRQVDVFQYTEGTLLLGMLDPAKHELLWRGTATMPVEEDFADRALIDEVVAKVLADFPSRR